MVTPPELRFLYLTGRRASTKGAIARASVICFSSSRTCSRVMSRRSRTFSHSSYESMNQEVRDTYNTSAPSMETLRRKARFSPSIAVPIKVTVTTPMTMPSVASMDRSLLARIASPAMKSPSLSSVKKFMRRRMRRPERVSSPLFRRWRSNRRECGGSGARGGRPLLRA